MQIVILCENCSDPIEFDAEFRRRCAELDLVTTLDSTLATIPGSTHLHLRPRDAKKGVLEYTMDARAKRAWLSWHENRYQPWIELVVAQLRAN